MCTGLSRIMATAMGQGEEVHVLDQLRRAIREPDTAHASALRAVVRDAQGRAAAGFGVGGVVDRGGCAGRFLANTARSSQFILSGAKHSMACAVVVLGNGRREYLLYDPNFGLMLFKKLSSSTSG